MESGSAAPASAAMGRRAIKVSPRSLSRVHKGGVQRVRGRTIGWTLKWQL